MRRIVVLKPVMQIVLENTQYKKGLAAWLKW
jgi:hypothetical protein